MSAVYRKLQKSSDDLYEISTDLESSCIEDLELKTEVIDSLEEALKKQEEIVAQQTTRSS